MSNFRKPAKSGQDHLNPIRISHSQIIRPSAFPFLIAIVGGSGSGKTWLAEKLLAILRGKAAHLSLDDFYRDRSHLSPARRAKLNFDNPAGIDWSAFHRVIRNCFHGRETRIPGYDFKTHCRLNRGRTFKPNPIILVDGLWVLRRPALRRLFRLRIFLECPVRTRLRRRLARDLRSRGRTRASVTAQFWKTVEPMHRKFVLPQRRWADVILRGKWDARQIEQLAANLRSFLKSAVSGPPPKPGRTSSTSPKSTNRRQRLRIVELACGIAHESG